MSTYIVDNGGGWGSLRPATRLDEKRLESTNNVGRDKFFKHMVAACLQIVNSSFEGENGGTSG